MINIELIFEDEFMESKAYKEWHDSFTDLIKLQLEPVHEFLDKHANPNINVDSPYTEKEIEKLKVRVNDLKIAHITKSIDLGLFFKELEEKQKE